MMRRDIFYVQMYQSRFVVNNVTTGQTIEVVRSQQCASPRMVLGDFITAEHELKGGIKKLRQSFLSPSILIHPMELVEGGLTQVELRAFHELGRGVGGSKVVTWEGAVLKGTAVSKAIDEYEY